MKYFNQLGSYLTSKQEFKVSSRLYGKYRNFTMIPFEAFHANIKLLSEVVKVPGCVVECGVWRGGMSAAMAEVIGNGRSYLLFDSFKGLPQAKTIDGNAAIEWQNDKSGKYYFDNCKAEIEYARTAMQMAGVKNVQFVKGWFEETLPTFVLADKIAVLRLDCDWYDSVLTCLEKFFPQVIDGGIVLIDDYFAWDGCAIAVHEYLAKHKLPFRIQSIDKRLAYITK